MKVQVEVIFHDDKKENFLCDCLPWMDGEFLNLGSPNKRIIVSNKTIFRVESTIKQF